MQSQTECYRIAFQPHTGYVMMKWEGYATSAEFKEGTELMLNTLIKNQATKVLADIKGMTLIGMEDQQWLNNVFLPRAINFGLKAVAITWPDYYFNKVAVETVSDNIDKTRLQVAFFDTKAQAEEWLLAI